MCVFSSYLMKNYLVNISLNTHNSTQLLRNQCNFIYFVWFTGTLLYLYSLTTSTFIIHIRIKLQFCSFASTNLYFKIVLCGGCCPTQLPFLFLKVHRKVSEWSVHPLTAASNAERWIASSVILEK